MAHIESRAFGDGAQFASEGSCPYGAPRAHAMRYFATERCDGAAYEASLPAGWRRSGNLFYQNACAGGCRECVPIRIDANRIAPGKTQRRIIRQNADLSITAAENAYSDEDFTLFRDYLLARHPSEAQIFDENSYYRSYVQSPLPSLIARYRDETGKLVALSYLDMLSDGFSSVYFAFEPSEERRSLGSYSVFAEAAILRELGKRWYYLGFWVRNCPKMAYKTKFRPYELAENGEWICSTNES